eukprot:5848693-Prymnesium_polylepis.1
MARTLAASTSAADALSNPVPLRSGRSAAAAQVLPGGDHASVSGRGSASVACSQRPRASAPSSAGVRDGGRGSNAPAGPRVSQSHVSRGDIMDAWERRPCCVPRASDPA